MWISRDKITQLRLETLAAQEKADRCEREIASLWKSLDFASRISIPSSNGCVYGHSRDAVILALLEHLGLEPEEVKAKLSLKQTAST